VALRVSYYFAATERTGTVTAAWTPKSGAQLAIDGQLANVDVRAGCDGEGVECVLAPPTTVVADSSAVARDNNPTVDSESDSDSDSGSGALEPPSPRAVPRPPGPICQNRGRSRAPAVPVPDLPGTGTLPRPRRRRFPSGVCARDRRARRVHRAPTGIIYI
jgi:hypothetical protein